MPETRWTIPVGDDSVSAVYEPAPSSRGVVCLCAHGAGGNMDNKGVTAVTRALRAKGIDTVRFNFVYSEGRGRRPDPMPKCMSVISAVADYARKAVAASTLIIGGRSMGGRAASMLAAEGFGADRLLLLAYPLHPPGKPMQLRTGHLAAVRVPVLCLSGTRDAFCQPALMDATLSHLGSNWTMHWIEAADHSFHVLKSSGRTDADVMGEIADSASEWLANG